MFEKQERLCLTIYLHYNRDARKLNKYGDMIYHSRKMRYVLLYVNHKKSQELMTKLKSERFVKKLIPSYIKEIDQDFVGSLWGETDNKVKL